MTKKRIVPFTVTANGAVMPSIPQYGGVKGEHNAAQLSMTLASGIVMGDELVRLQFTCGDGAVVSSDRLEGTLGENGQLILDYPLPQVVTLPAGQLSVRVVVSTIDDSGEETQTFRSGEAVLYFDEATVENGTPFWTGVSQMLACTAQASAAAVEAKEIAVDAVGEAEELLAEMKSTAAGKLTYKGIATGSMLSSLVGEVGDLYYVTTSDSYVFWDGDEWVTIERPPDRAVDTASDRAVSGAAVARYVTEQIAAISDKFTYKGEVSGAIWATLTDMAVGDVYRIVDEGSLRAWLGEEYGWYALSSTTLSNVVEDSNSPVGSAGIFRFVQEQYSEQKICGDAIGTTFPPSQKPAAADLDGYDMDILSATAEEVYAYIDQVVSGKATVTKEILGKDASGKYDVARYIVANREHCAWVRENYPKLYAWKNGDTVMYTESVSPRVGDKAYDVPYIGGTTTEIVTVPAQAALIEGYRWSGSGKAFTALDTCAILIVPTKDIAAPFTITLDGMTVHATYNVVYGGDPTPTAATVYGNATGNTSAVSVETPADCIWFMVNRPGTSGEFDGAKVIVDGEEVNVVASATTTYTDDIRQATTETVETEGGGTPITEVRVADVASDATANDIPSSRIIGDAEYVRYADGDVKPTVIYTDADDERNSGTSITQDGITYHRYPLGDLGANRSRPIPIVMYANEHGISPAKLESETYETKLCALVAARLLRDLAAGRQAGNPLYTFIRSRCMLIVIPVANPFGFHLNVTGDTPAYAWTADGYYNCNGVNINRNYDTPGWIVSKNGGGGHHGSYPGSEIETQYIMNTMVESGAAVAMSLHGMGGTLGNRLNDVWEVIYAAVQGQNPDGTDYNQVSYAKVKAFLKEQYNRTMGYYDTHLEVATDDPLYGTPHPCQAMPSFTCKSPSYITQCGAYGGIVEFSPDANESDGAFQQEMKAHVIETAYAQTLNLMAMWLSDYCQT